MVFKCSIELCDEVSESSEGKQGTRDGALAEGHGPGEGGPLCHVGESKGDLLLVSVVDGIVNEEVEQPVHRFVIGSIEHLGNTDA